MQRAHSHDEMERALKGAGLEIVGVYDELTFDAPGDECERVFYVVCKGR